MANRFDVSMKRSPERFALENERWVIEMSKDGIHPRAFPQISSWVKSSGGSIEVSPKDQDDVNIIFPAGTSVEEFDVPAEHNIQNFISCDARVSLPNGRALAFHQHGVSESLWIEKD